MISLYHRKSTIQIVLADQLTGAARHHWRRVSQALNGSHREEMRILLATIEETLQEAIQSEVSWMFRRLELDLLISIMMRVSKMTQLIIRDQFKSNQNTILIPTWRTQIISLLCFQKIHIHLIMIVSTQKNRKYWEPVGLKSQVKIKLLLELVILLHRLLLQSSRISMVLSKEFMKQRVRSHHSVIVKVKLSVEESQKVDRKWDLATQLFEWVQLTCQPKATVLQLYQKI